MDVQSGAMKKRAWRTIREIEDELRDLALRILHHPELGYEEVQFSFNEEEIMKRKPHPQE